MKSKTRKRLVLARRTIRPLNQDHMARAAGGFRKSWDVCFSDEDSCIDCSPYEPGTGSDFCAPGTADCTGDCTADCV